MKKKLESKVRHAVLQFYQSKKEKMKFLSSIKHSQLIIKTHLILLSHPLISHYVNVHLEYSEVIKRQIPQTSESNSILLPILLSNLSEKNLFPTISSILSFVYHLSSSSILHFLMKIK